MKEPRQKLSNYIHLSFLDGLRGVAVLLVILSHTSQVLGSGQFGHHSIELLVQAGDRGVQLFFILSAFTLFNSSLKNFAADQLPWPSFYVRRVFRIFPFWVAIVAYWALSSSHTLLQAVLAITFLFGFVRFNGSYELVPGGWTLFVEETFYLLLPFLILKVTTLRRAIWFGIVLLLMSQLWIVYAPRLPLFQTNGFVFFAPPAQWFAFGLGIIGYYLYMSDWFKHLKEPANNRLLNVVAIVMFCLLIEGEFRLATIGLFALTVAGATQTGIIARVLDWRVLRLFGKYCYSIYLLQFVVITIFAKYNDQFFNALGLLHRSYELKMLVAFPLFCTILIVAGSITYVLIEKPCVGLGRSLIARWNTTPFKFKRTLPAFIWSPTNYRSLSPQARKPH